MEFIKTEPNIEMLPVRIKVTEPSLDKPVPGGYVLDINFQLFLYNAALQELQGKSYHRIIQDIYFQHDENTQKKTSYVKILSYFCRSLNYLFYDEQKVGLQCIGFLFSPLDYFRELIKKEFVDPLLAMFLEKASLFFSNNKNGNEQLGVFLTIKNTVEKNNYLTYKLLEYITAFTKIYDRHFLLLTPGWLLDELELNSWFVQIISNFDNVILYANDVLLLGVYLK